MLVVFTHPNVVSDFHIPGLRNGYETTGVINEVLCDDLGIALICLDPFLSPGGGDRRRCKDLSFDAMIIEGMEKRESKAPGFVTADNICVFAKMLFKGFNHF